MNKYYLIQYFNKIINNWVAYNQTKYSSLLAAQKEVKSYREHKLNLKVRIMKIEIL